VSAPPFALNRTNRQILRLLLDHDDGQMYGLTIANSLPRRWCFRVPSGAVAVELMKLERYKWVTSEWEEAQTRENGGWQPRRRFYRIADAHREDVQLLLGTGR
jgi:DNA-binding PadR family transcriptional regulator